MKKTYEIWALAYDKDYNIKDFDQLIGEFNSKSEAISYAKKMDVNDVVEKDKLLEDDIVHIQVETVVESKGGFENIDTLYEADYTLKDEILI